MGPHVCPSAAPVLRDLQASCPVPEAVWDGASGELEDAEHRWGLALESVDGARTERWFAAAPSVVEQTVFVADTVQDWTVETLNGLGISPVWPVCPRHPSTHPLDPIADGGVAVWACPKDGTILAPIGTLQ